MSSQESGRTTQRITDLELADPQGTAAPEHGGTKNGSTNESAAAESANLEPTWSQVASPAESTPPPGLVDRALPPAGLPDHVKRPSTASGTASNTTASSSTAGGSRTAPDATESETTQVIPPITDDSAPTTKPDSTPQENSASGVSAPDAKKTTATAAEPTDSETTQIIPPITDDSAPEAAKRDSAPTKAPAATTATDSASTSAASAGNAPEPTDSETTQIIPPITDAPAPQHGGQHDRGQQDGYQGHQEYGQQQFGQQSPSRELPKFPPAPPRKPHEMFPPGVPLQIYTQNANPAPETPPHPMPAQRPSDRSRVMTSSPSGLVVGLLGVVISAVLTYAFDLVRDGSNGYRLVFSLAKASSLLNNLTKIGDFPLWQAPLAVLLPLLPVAQLVLVLVLCLPRTRLVGKGLVTRARVTSVLGLSAITVYQVVATVLNAGTSSTLILLALFLVGDLIVLLALLFPHWPRGSADSSPSGH